MLDDILNPHHQRFSVKISTQPFHLKHFKVVVKSLAFNSFERIVSTKAKFLREVVEFFVRCDLFHVYSFEAPG